MLKPLDAPPHAAYSLDLNSTGLVAQNAAGGQDPSPNHDRTRKRQGAVAMHAFARLTPTRLAHLVAACTTSMCLDNQSEPGLLEEVAQHLPTTHEAQRAAQVGHHVA